MSAGTLVPRLARDTAVRRFLQPFEPLLEDESVTEIAVNGEGNVFCEKQAVWIKAPHVNASQEHILQLGVAVATFSQQKWDKSMPLLSASLPQGERIQLVMPPAVEEGRISFTLRKPSTVVRKLSDFAKDQLFAEVKPISDEVTEAEESLMNLQAERRYEEFFRQAVLHRMNIVVSGATGSGKTTFMKGLVQEIPEHERLVTIEDTRELFVPQENAVHLLYSKGGQSQASVKPKDLLECCLRMKPDRILLAELRGDECLYFIRNAASGHPGSITSCHAGSTALAFEQLALMIQDSPGGANLQFSTIKRLLLLTIDVVVQFQNHGGKRFISEIYFDPKVKRKVKHQ
jgi:type IV secretion system protein VirB11